MTTCKDKDGFWLLSLARPCLLHWPLSHLARSPLKPPDDRWVASRKVHVLITQVLTGVGPSSHMYDEDMATKREIEKEKETGQSLLVRLTDICFFLSLPVAVSASSSHHITSHS